VTLANHLDNNFKVVTDPFDWRRFFCLLSLWAVQWHDAGGGALRFLYHVRTAYQWGVGSH